MISKTGCNYTKCLVSLCIVCLWLLLASSARSAEILSVGDVFPEFQARDQHDRNYVFEPGVRVVLIAFDMSPAKKANKFLAGQPADYLDRNQAVYVANIHGMPGIGRHFALPKMKKYPHRIILADAENLLSPFPSKEKRITVIRLNEQAIDYWDPALAPLDIAAANSSR